jgi:hypothetical protein
VSHVVLRRRHDVVHFQQRVVRCQRFLLEHIESGTGDLAPPQRLGESRLVDDRPPARVDEDRRRLHGRQPLGIDDVSCPGGQRRVTGDDVRCAEQLLQ